MSLLLVAGITTIWVPGHAGMQLAGVHASPADSAVPCVPIPDSLGVNDRCPTWTATYDSALNTTGAPDFDDVSAMAVSPTHDRIFTTGVTPGVTGFTLTDIAKYLPIMCSSPDCSTNGVNRYDMITAAWSADGKQLWTARYDGPLHLEDAPAAIAVSHDGARVFVAGYSDDNGTMPEHSDVRMTIIAYDAASGRMLWHDATLTGHATAVRTSPDGRFVYITGNSPEPGTPYFAPNGAFNPHGYLTVAYDASTGRRIWSDRYRFAPGDMADPTVMDIARDGHLLYVTGSSVSSNQGYTTIAYDAQSGARRWLARFDDGGSKDRRPTDMAISSNGMVVVTGSSGPVANATVAFDGRTGHRLWATGDFQTGSGGWLPARVVIDPQNSSVYVIDTTPATPANPALDTTEFMIRVLDPRDGHSLWHITYAGPYSSAMANGVAVSSDGSQLYVAGTEIYNLMPGGGSSYDFVTVAFDTRQQEQAWVSRYPTTPLDYPIAGVVGYGYGGVDLAYGGENVGVVVAATIVDRTDPQPALGLQTDHNDHTVEWNSEPPQEFLLLSYR